MVSWKYMRAVVCLFRKSRSSTAYNGNWRLKSIHITGKKVICDLIETSGHRYPLKRE